MASDPEAASILGGNGLPLFCFICFHAMVYDSRRKYRKGQERAYRHTVHDVLCESKSWGGPFKTHLCISFQVTIRFACASQVPCGRGNSFHIIGPWSHSLRHVLQRPMSRGSSSWVTCLPPDVSRLRRGRVSIAPPAPTLPRRLTYPATGVSKSPSPKLALASAPPILPRPRRRWLCACVLSCYGTTSDEDEDEDDGYAVELAADAAALAVERKEPPPRPVRESLSSDADRHQR
jgi:hypothetical protein